MDAHTERAFCPVLVANFLIHWNRFKGQINSIIALLIMPYKSLNLEFTAKLYAKIEVVFTVSMAVLKFVNTKSTKNLNYTFVQCWSPIMK